MLADIRSAAAGSKRKRRDVMVSEAYPESEYNLNPASASAGEAAEFQPIFSLAATVPWYAAALKPMHAQLVCPSPGKSEIQHCSLQAARAGSCSCRT